ncbi:MAG TPA: glycosyltransferase family 1 protein [Burkholderiaceae bacterium]|nr:glycosyltransferase family 1 protein [Burkholderiaceae bacterium]
MRIAFVTETYPPEINGVATSASRTVAYLRGHGHEVRVLRPCQDGEAVGESPDGPESESGGEWHSPGWPIPVYSNLRFGTAWPATLVAQFRAWHPHVVHIATEGPLGWAAIAAARRLGLATSSDFRTNFHEYSRYYHCGWLAPLIERYLRRFHNRTERCFVPTRQLRRDLVGAGYEHVEVVGRGVDLELFAPERRDEKLRERWSALGAPVLLHVGRLAPEKNVELALRAFGMTRRFVPGARMVVVGDGPQRAQLERRYPEAQFVGMQTGAALAAHYASADVFLFPSLTDTFGNVTLEALASGVPVVAFDCAAAAEYVADRLNGRLVTPGDEAGFIRVSCLLACRFGALARMRRAARQAALRADWDRALHGFERQLHETIDAHRTADSTYARMA